MDNNGNNNQGNVNQPVQANNANNVGVAPNQVVGPSNNVAQQGTVQGIVAPSAPVTNNVVNPQQNVNASSGTPVSQQSQTVGQNIQGGIQKAQNKQGGFQASKIVDLIKKYKLIVIGILVIVVIAVIFSGGGKSGSRLKNNGTNSTENSSNETGNQGTKEEKDIEGTFVIGSYRMKLPEGYELNDTIDGTLNLTNEDGKRIQLTLEKYQTAYKKSLTIEESIANVYALDGYETQFVGLKKINQTPWAIYEGIRDDNAKTIAFVEFQSKMLKVQLDNEDLEYNTKVLEEITELIKHVTMK